MSVLRISYNNFKNNIKTYLMFFISMVFSVVVLSNFMILMNSSVLDYIGKANKNYSIMMLKMLTTVLVIFMVFFIWYATNVFLKNRKKEIGIYTFMGVDSVTVGKMYFIEVMLIGLSSCALGTVIGVVLSKFFQMIIFKIAGFNIDVNFQVTPNAIISSAVIFTVIFLLMSIKGFTNIVKSSVIDLLNDNKKGDKVHKTNILTYIIAIISLVVVIYAYYLAVKSTANFVNALIMVCIGTYGLFGSTMVILFNFLINRKSILYKGENIITINSLAYKIRKNYTTYATIAILTASSITVLGLSVSMKKTYSNAKVRNEIYSAAFVSNNKINNQDKIEDTLRKFGDEKYKYSTEVLTFGNDNRKVEGYAVISYSKFKEMMNNSNNKEYIDKIKEEDLKGDKAVFIPRASLLGSTVSEDIVNVADRTFKGREDYTIPLFSCAMSETTLIVSDENYKALESKGEKVNFYGIKISNDEKLQDGNILPELLKYAGEGTSVSIGTYETSSLEWLKIVYALGAFLFFVFMLSEASIIYIKIFSDANEDKDKYKILKNIGTSSEEIKRSINKEVLMFYAIPVGVGIIHSYFAIESLGKLLNLNLFTVFLVSVIASLVIFGISGVISSKSFKTIVKAD